MSATTLTLADIVVAGPTEAKVSIGGASYVSFGMSDNENLPQWTRREMFRQVKTSASGEAAEQVIRQGMMGAVSLTLVQCDLATLELIQAAQSGGAQNISVVGGVLAATAVADSATWGLQIVPLEAGKPGIQFARCWADGDGWVQSKWGNWERTYSANIIVMPDPTTGVLYTNITSS
jgi:hypothetical protein